MEDLLWMPWAQQARGGGVPKSRWGPHGFHADGQRPIVAALALRAHHHYGAKEQRELIARPFSSAYVRSDELRLTSVQGETSLRRMDYLTELCAAATGFSP